uniref:RRM domain-containing protein n=1 Tax=Parascaris equorum TaxID=6256 RepID=A0A914RPU4_PAREQ
MTRRDLVVKCRGLPWSCTEEEIRIFFQPADRSIVKITLTKNRDARPSGEAFVAFNNNEDYEYALSRDKQHMGQRYIEVWISLKSVFAHRAFNPNLNFIIPLLFQSIVRASSLPFPATSLPRNVPSLFLYRVLFSFAHIDATVIALDGYAI